MAAVKLDPQVKGELHGGSDAPQIEGLSQCPSWGDMEGVTMVGGAHLPSALPFVAFWPGRLEADLAASFAISSLIYFATPIISIPIKSSNTHHTMSVTTNANKFEPLEEALSGAGETIHRTSYGGIHNLRCLDSEWVNDDKTGKRSLVRLDFVHKAANKVTDHMQSFATQMTFSDGSATSKLKIVVEKAELRLPPAFANPNIKSYGTGPRRSDVELPPTLSVDAMVTAQGSLNEDGATEQTDPKRFECDVSYNGQDWERVERIVDDGTLVPDDVSQPDAATEASHTACK
jgi:hypothetical protein